MERLYGLFFPAICLEGADAYVEASKEFVPERSLSFHYAVIIQDAVNGAVCWNTVR